MLNSISESERVARQLVSAISPALPASKERIMDACEAFVIPQLVDNTPASLAQAIFAVYDYSSDVLSQYPSLQYSIDDEILEPLWNLGEEIAQYDSISVAQQTVEDWVEDRTVWW